MKDVAKLIEDFMLEPNEKFKDLKPYLLSEFEWNIDPLKDSHFLIRGMPVSDDLSLDDLLKKYLPEEVIILKEI